MRLTFWPCMFAIMAFAISSRATRAHSPKSIERDVCVYGATPSGILAAIAAKRGGCSVVIVEPSRWVGGMLGAGLKPMQDCPNYAATGGMTKDLLVTLGRSAGKAGKHDLRALSPLAIRQDFRVLLKKHGVEVTFEHRISRCARSGATITEAWFNLAPFDQLGCPVAMPKQRDSLSVKAKIFIDASYEGDLMHAAGVSYRVGREAAVDFNEEHAGVQPPLELTPIDPFVEPGTPNSGLLPLVENDHGKPVGSADDYTQAYNYRYYTTSEPKLRLPIKKPEGYDPKQFELVGRYVAHLRSTIKDPKELRRRLVGICPGWMNSGEWNYQRNSLISMAPVGISQRYASGNFAEKAAVWKEHQDYLRGLFHFMRTDPRIPESYRTEVAELGLDKRFHPETQGWPHQLYIRVARRLKGRYTITAHDVYNRRMVEDPIGLAQYGIDTYPSRRVWLRRDGEVLVGIEGKMFVGGNRGPTHVPYPIPYRAITPHATECTNLLVPVCFSATHLGYASARMEPVFMICGESAGIAADLAIEQGVGVQDIDTPRLAAALKAAGQKTSWDESQDRPARAKGAAHAVRAYATLLKECDRNNDGIVTSDEWKAGKPTWKWLFSFIDKDKNGEVDKAEYDAFQQFKKKNPDWQKLKDS